MYARFLIFVACIVLIVLAVLSLIEYFFKIDLRVMGSLIDMMNTKREIKGLKKIEKIYSMKDTEKKKGKK